MPLLAIKRLFLCVLLHSTLTFAELTTFDPALSDQALSVQRLANQENQTSIGYSPLADSKQDLRLIDKATRPIVRIAADYDYPPYEFIDEYGFPRGYTVELTRAIAAVMGFDVDFVMTDWKSALDGLYAGKYDALQRVAATQYRAKDLLFSSPHSIVNQSLFARLGAPEINHIEVLRGQSVIVQNSGSMHDYLLENHIGANIVPTRTHSEALRLLSAGEYHYALIANLPSLYLSKELKINNIYPVASLSFAQRLSYAALPHNEELMAKFSEGLAILKSTGRQQEIYNKWFGTVTKDTIAWDKIGRFAAYAIALLLVILSGIIVWNTMLRKEVEKRSIQLKAQQEQLIQADKMASLGVLVSGVAHEINNPTSLLMLNLPLLKEAWEDALPYLEEQAQTSAEFSLAGLPFARIKQELPFLLDEMDQSTLRIRNIVNDLKDFARSETDEIKQEVNLNAVVATAVRLVDKSIRSATNQFEMHLDARQPIILGRAQRIEQVIINLIINACDALESPQGYIKLTTSISLDLQQVYIVIEDQGKGIAAEHLTRLTDPFFTTKRDQGGTGLGLSVSAGIIQSHAGRLAFDSQPALGTSVTVTLPLVHTLS
mgnify:CR=1 FL=1